MSCRSTITKALVEVLKQINGRAPYTSNLYGKNVIPKNKFWDEVKDFPYICVVAGSETREYHPSSFAWGFLTVALKLYVYGDNSADKLEGLITDVETVITNNETLVIGQGALTTEILITSIVTDEGLLDPYGVGEITLQVRYPINLK